MRLSSVTGAALAALAATTLALASVPAAAQLAPGSRLTFSGVADATELGAPGVALDFDPFVFADRTANTGSFAWLNLPLPSGVPGVPGVIRDIVVGSGPQSVRRFLTIGTYTFDLVSLPSGPYGQDDCYVDPAPGQLCTPIQLPGTALSPFYLANEASGDPAAAINTVIAFDLVGTVRGLTGPRSTFTGTIFTAFPGVSFQEALFALEAFGLEDIPFMATFVVGDRARFDVTAAPEPSTYALLATGLAGVAAAARRRRRREGPPTA